MSYDVDLMIDTGADEPISVWERNHTSNCAPMWRKAGANLAEMDGMPAPEAELILTRAIDTMRENPAEYEALNPPNKWGDYDSCVRFLAAIRDACRIHTKTTLAVSH